MGVSTTPWAVVIFPARARVSELVAVTLKENMGSGVWCLVLLCLVSGVR
jgi:hypothetical protein